ncbi:MAG: glycosyl hydrolase family 39 [Bacteroidota bacterium]
MASKILNNTLGLILVGAAACLPVQKLSAQAKKVTINWDKTVSVSKTTPTLQVVYNPYIRSNSPIYKGTFEALKNMGADYVRYVPWFPYPKAAVVELKEPTKDQTFWDFTYADPAMEDVMKAQEGRSVVINFSTIPVWMFKTDKPVVVDEDPDAVNWVYNQGKELRDPSMKELAGYFGRLLSWYTKGGFTDELGKYHKSGHFYKIPYWEVLNEPDLEHKISPEMYTKMYDAIVTEMRKVQPNIKFVGISVAHETDPNWFEHFLNAANHKPGIPLDGISYHFYGRPSINDLPIENYQYSFFDQADGFLDRVRYIENIRKRLAPKVFTQINEIGNILLDHDYKGVIAPGYWNLSGAMFAYIYLELTKIGIDVAGESQLVGYPTQFPDVSMMNWKNSKPNARYWVLKLIKQNFGPGDKLQTTGLSSQDIAAQAFITAKGKKLLLINKHDKELQLDLPVDAKGATVDYVDMTTGDNPIGQTQLSSNTITLKPFAVTVVSWK